MLRSYLLNNATSSLLTNTCHAQYNIVTFGANHLKSTVQLVQLLYTIEGEHPRGNEHFNTTLCLIPINLHPENVLPIDDKLEIFL